MAGWYHQCNRHELGQTPADGQGQGGCSPWGCKELGTTGQLSNICMHVCIHIPYLVTCYAFCKNNNPCLIFFWGLVFSPTHQFVFTVCVCMLSRFSHDQLFVIIWAIACQILWSMGFSKQEYWHGLPCFLPGDLPDPGIKPVSFASPAWAEGFFTTSATWEALFSLGTSMSLPDSNSLFIVD